jgi:hypothetical protein
MLTWANLLILALSMRNLIKRESQRGEFFVGRITFDDSKIHGYNGMFPCLRGGKVSLLFLSARSARVTWARVDAGSMTASI